MPLVDQDAVHTAANGFEGQMHAACDVLQRYLASVNNVNAPGRGAARRCSRAP